MDKGDVIVDMWKDTRSNREVLSDIIATEKPEVMVEIGVWKSNLLKYILRKHGNLIKEYWATDPFHPFDYINDFEEDMKQYVKTTQEGWDNAHLYACKLMYYFPQLRILRLNSLEAAKLFPDNYFDLVFIDADHRYDAVSADIKAWFPLVRIGGILSGHDYKSTHPGVIKAVDEILGKDITIMRDSSVWMKKKYYSEPNI